MSKGGFSVNVSLSGPLAQRFKAYLKREWPGQQMAPAIMRRALREFLDRELTPVSQDPKETNHD